MAMGAALKFIGQRPKASSSGEVRFIFLLIRPPDGVMSI
jgi:hypothetical protein